MCVTHANGKWTGDFFFQNANSQPYFINQGDTNPKRRSEIVETFNTASSSSSSCFSSSSCCFSSTSSSPLVLLLSLCAGGVGLNLVGANHLFLLDLHWNPALEAQAVDRIYRVGQTKPVFVHKFICKVEMKVFFYVSTFNNIRSLSFSYILSLFLSLSLSLSLSLFLCLSFSLGDDRGAHQGASRAEAETGRQHPWRWRRQRWWSLDQTVFGWIETFVWTWRTCRQNMMHLLTVWLRPDSFNKRSETMLWQLIEKE